MTYRFLGHCVAAAQRQLVAQRTDVISARNPKINVDYVRLSIGNCDLKQSGEEGGVAHSPVLAKACGVLGQAFWVDHATEQSRLVVWRRIFDGDQHGARQAFHSHARLDCCLFAWGRALCCCCFRLGSRNGIV